MNLNQIRKQVNQNNYRLSFHAEIERDADQISIREIREALLSSEAKIIEDYPNDPRGHSCLVLGFTKKKLPIHIVCGRGDEEILIVITLYRPDPDEWINWQNRREKKS